MSGIDQNPCLHSPVILAWYLLIDNSQRKSEREGWENLNFMDEMKLIQPIPKCHNNGTACISRTQITDLDICMTVTVQVKLQ